jgi:hypothetical protein
MWSKKFSSYFFRRRKLQPGEEESVAAWNGSFSQTEPGGLEVSHATKTIASTGKRQHHAANCLCGICKSGLQKKYVKDRELKQHMLSILRSDGHSKKESKRLIKALLKKGVTMLVSDKYTCGKCDHLLVDWPPLPDEEPTCMYCWDTGNELPPEEVDRRMEELEVVLGSTDTVPDKVSAEDIEVLEKIIERHAKE